MSSRAVALAVAVALLAGACGEASELPTVPGVTGYFATLADAWSRGDPYDVVRFYDRRVRITAAQADLELSNHAAYWDTAENGRGRLWLSRWIRSETHGPRSVDGVFTGPGSALVILRMDAIGAAVALDLRIDGGFIVEQTSLRWRYAHKDRGIPTPRMAWVDSFISDYLAGRIVDTAPGSGTAGPGHTSNPEALRPGGVEALSSGDRDYPSVFVLPAIAPVADHDTLAFVVEASPHVSCRGSVAIILDLDRDRRISRQRWLPSIELWDQCDELEPLASPWWKRLEVPPPLAEQTTGTLTVPGGPSITVVNGSPEVGRLLRWGLSQFEAAGLPAPSLSSVMFGPAPACRGRAGAVTDTDPDRLDLNVCEDMFSACADSECTAFNRSTRFGLLHELAHVWMLEHLTDETRSAFMEHAGVDTWRSADVPWAERGVEHAADTLAWGLFDEPIELVRLGNPSCAEREAGFRLLTDTAPVALCQG